MGNQRADRFRVALGVICLGGTSWWGCAPEKPAEPVATQCYSAKLPVIAGSNGVASVFEVDPIFASGNLNLTPSSTHLDDFRKTVTLERLTGKGILEGQYTSVVNTIDCDDLFHAFDSKNNFSYSHADGKFSEAMTYYYADLFRHYMDGTGYLGPQASLKVIAHCEKDDNAYYYRNVVGTGIQSEGVCLGDSETSPGAYYSDDASVLMHEIQHGVTEVNYSPTVELSELGGLYEESGALNEAISDFMSASFLDSQFAQPAVIDPKLFSRWALGTFRLPMKSLRGAHACPGYDSKYPNCGAFPEFANDSWSSSKINSISYVYPDGLGWPYWNNYTSSSSSPVDVIFSNYPNQEEIHNTSVLLFGALWDVYSAVKNLHSGDSISVAKAVGQLVMESLRHLPLPNNTMSRSPVHFIALVNQMVTYMNGVAFFTDADRLAMKAALTARGLYGFIPLASDWMTVGTGTSFLQPKTVTPGMLVKDDPQSLKAWLSQMGADPKIVTQGLDTALNSQPDPGEVFAAWFDLKNNAAQTAGAVLVTVSVLDPGIEVLNGSVNPGFLSQASVPSAQVMYSKINGTEIVKALKVAGSGNTYFKTNPYFSRTDQTALWFKVSASAQHGQVVRLQVKAQPSNGAESVTEVAVTIH